MGIVGLPGSGRSSLFAALTGGHGPVGTVPIPDERLEPVARIESSAKVTPATLEVVDVPGTGSALLGNLRQMDALLAVVDAFSGTRDPAADREALLLEMVVADRDHVEGRLERVRTQAKSGDPRLREEVAELERVLAHAEEGRPLSDYPGELPRELEPLTTKPLVAIENGPGGIDLKLEAELVELPPEEAAEFRDGPSALAGLLAVSRSWIGRSNLPSLNAKVLWHPRPGGLLDDANRYDRISLAFITRRGMPFLQIVSAQGAFR